MKKQALAEFLKEMEKKPQTLGWDVVAAFDREKTNYLLLQDYISRFGSTSFFKPVTSSVSTGGTQHTLNGVLLDTPRLSFDNAVITDSRARCVMHTVGGYISEIVTPQGTTRKEVKRFGIANGLVGPILTMTIYLKNAKGDASADTVELDLAGNGATDFKFTGVDTAFEAGKLGEHLSDEIKRWSAAQKTFQLGQLRKNPGDPMQPGAFRVLTRPAPGGTVRHADNYGDGEVLLFIGLDDRSGELPASDSSLPYLLPEGYSSNLVISADEIVKRLMIDAIKETDELSKVKFDEVAEGGFTRFVAKEGAWSAGIEIDGWDAWNFEYDNAILSFTSTTKLTLERGSGGIKLKWAGSTEFNGQAITYVMNPFPAKITYDGRVRVHWDVECLFKPTLVEEESGRTVIVIGGEFTKDSTRAEFVSGSGDRAGEGYFKAAVEGVGKSIGRRISGFRSTFEGIGITLDAFRLNGLLFADESVVVPKTIKLPGDLTALGDLGAELTKYRLSHNEITVTASGNHTFTVIPELEGVKWSVAALSNEAGGEANVGEINEATGVYTAPAAANFGFSFRRVIVTAKTDKWSAKALVHLVAAPVSVFPMVNAVNLTTEHDGQDVGGYTVWAGSTHGGALDWKISGDANGTLKTVDDPNVQDARQYWAPKEFPSGGTGLDKVLRVDKVEVSQAGGPSATCAMLLAKTPKHEYYFILKPAVGGVQFEFWVKPDEGPDELVPNYDIEWHAVIGNGTIDEHGTYLFATGQPDHCFVVAAIDLAESGRNLQWNYKFVTQTMLDASGAATQQPRII